MYLVAGLGNPGPRYAPHRHNIGFVVVDRLADRWGAPDFRDAHAGLLSKAEHGGVPVVLLKPQTFMNRSGESVQPALAWFDAPRDRLLVVHDELDLPFGTLRLKAGGGAAGHNGLRSISERCGGGDYLRLRFGIGRPPPGAATQSHVLNAFSAEERAELPPLVDRACEMVEAVTAEGLAHAMNRFHRKPENGPG